MNQSDLGLKKLWRWAYHRAQKFAVAKSKKNRHVMSLFWLKYTFKLSKKAIGSVSWNRLTYKTRCGWLTFFFFFFIGLERFWGQPKGQKIPSLSPEQPCWLYALIALQQRSPLLRKFDPSEDWLRSRCFIYQEVHARTKRLYDSPIFHMRRLLNGRQG